MTTTINGTSGDDELLSTEDIDTIHGLDGNDRIATGIGPDFVYGDAGDDTFWFNSIGFGSSSYRGEINGGDGFDTIDLRDVSSYSLQLNEVPLIQVYVGTQAYQLSGIERILLGPKNDLIYTFGLSDPHLQIWGGDGNDQFWPTPSTAMYGEAGDDVFHITGSFEKTIGIVDGGTGLNTIETGYYFLVDLAAHTADSQGSHYTVTNVQNVVVRVSGLTSTVLGDEASNTLSVIALEDWGNVGVTFDGRGGDDTLIGSLGADLLTGGVGHDSLYGGAGDDVFRDNAAGVDGDTITDFSKGDRIVITDATLATFTFNLSGNTLTYTGGSLTLSGPISGTLVASAAAGGGVQLTIVKDASNDFNGDGRSDIMFRHDNGAITNFLGTANGGILNNGDNTYTVVDNSWELAGTGDFNGDGRDDVLWRNASGAMFNFLGTANGGVQNNGDNSYMSLSASWTVSGVGDFNGDAKDDILFRDANGVIFDYLGTASGGFTGNTDNLYTDIGDEWHVSGVGDFNGDGRDDILFRNDSGAITNFLGTANGGILNNGDNIYTVVDNAWHIAGVGDFNGDGRDDILWRNDNGAVFTFLSTASGGVINNGDNSYAAMSNVWHVEAIGDYNRDGRDDILWRHDYGSVIDWLGAASGGFTDNSWNLYTSIALQWQVAPADALV